jgi:hypothetical protein
MEEEVGNGASIFSSMTWITNVKKDLHSRRNPNSGYFPRRIFHCTHLVSSGKICALLYPVFAT